MDIRVLRYFLAIAREGSVTRAAERLHISQPTLSKQLKSLEQELGKKLFTRGNAALRLTAEGMLLRQRAEDIVEMLDKTEHEFRALGEITGGDIHIGCAESYRIQYLARRIQALQEKYPGIRVHITSGDTNDLSGRLDQGLLDFAVIAEAVDLARYNYLEMPGTDVWGVVMRRDAPLAAKEAVRAEDLLDLPIVAPRQGLREDIPKLLGDSLDRLHIAATVNLAYNGAVLVKAGLGYLLTFDRLADTGSDSELCFRPLTPVLETKLYVIWKKYQVFSPAAEALLEELKENLASPDDRASGQNTGATNH